MKKTSPTAHLVRLGVVFVIFIGVFITAKTVMTPTSWNHDINNWYRLDSLEEMKEKQISYGDNKSCKGCHKKTYKRFRKKKHKGLSCESCHGALALHINVENLDIEKVLKGKIRKADTEKIADAPLAYGWPAALQAAHMKNGGTVIPESASAPVIVKSPVRAAVMWQCRNCHLKMVNKPVVFKQFTSIPEDKKYKKHAALVVGEIEDRRTGDPMCLTCHDPHDPTP